MCSQVWVAGANRRGCQAWYRSVTSYCSMICLPFQHIILGLPRTLSIIFFEAASIRNGPSHNGHSQHCQQRSDANYAQGLSMS
jgi:hypothetical protein